MNKLIIFTLMIFLITFVSADIQVWQGKYLTGSSSTSYTFNFTVYNNLTGGSICYSNQTILTTNSDKWWNTYQYNVASMCSNSSIDYYLNINIDGTDQPPRRLLNNLKYANLDSAYSIFQGSLEANNFTVNPYIITSENDNFRIMDGAGDILIFNKSGNKWDMGTKKLAFGDAEIEHENRVHEPTYFSGQNGLDDLNSSGNYSLEGNSIFQIRINNIGTPDKFKWRKDTTGAWTGPVAMTGSAQLLQDNIFITWGATTGHDNNDQWEINVGHEIHINDAVHILNDLTVNNDFVLAGQARSLSPFKFWDGIRFVNKETGSSEFHLYISGTDSATTQLSSVFDGALVFKTNIGSNPSNMDAVFWDAINSRPSFIINQGGTARASIFERSLLIGKNKGNATLNGNYTKCEGFNLIDCETSSTGADLGVEDDIEAKGSILSQENITANYFLGDGSQLSNVSTTIEEYYKNFLGSGIISGGIASKGTYNISWTAGTALIVNVSNASNIQVDLVSFPITTTDPSMSGKRSMWSYVIKNSTGGGEIVITDDEPTPLDDHWEMSARLSKWWTNGTGEIIRGHYNYGAPAYNLQKRFEAFLWVFGTIKKSGNSYTFQGANRLLTKSAGVAWRAGAGYSSDPTEPDVFSSGISNISTYGYYDQDDLTVTEKTEIDNAYWDNGGTLQALQNNYWKCDRVWGFPGSGYTHVTYGQAEYPSSSEALSGYETEGHVYNKLSDGAYLGAWVCIEEGKTDCSSEDNCIIRNAGTFAGGGGGAGVTYTAGEGLILNSGAGVEFVLNTTYTDDRYINSNNDTGNFTLFGNLTADYLFGIGSKLEGIINKYNSVADDNTLYLNNKHTNYSSQTGGIVVNVLPVDGTINDFYTSTFTTGVDGVNNAQVTSINTYTYINGQLVQLSGTKNNDGLYEVMSHIGGLLKIRGVGNYSTQVDYVADNWDSGIDSGRFVQVNVAVLRAGIDGKWEVGYGNNYQTAFTDLGSLDISIGQNTPSNITDRLYSPDGNTLYYDGQQVGTGEGYDTPEMMDLYCDARNDPTIEGTCIGGTATLVGVANYDGGPNHIQLTNTSIGQFGSIYWDVKTGRSFKASFEFWTGGGTGGDAIWFFINANDSCIANPAVEGGNCGSGSYSIIFDEYNGHARLMRDGILLSQSSASSDWWANSQWHRAVIVVEGPLISISVDGRYVLDYEDSNNITGSGDSFGGNRTGLAGRSGGSTNGHFIKDVRIISPVSYWDNIIGTTIMTGLNVRIGGVGDDRNIGADVPLYVAHPDDTAVMRIQDSDGNCYHYPEAGSEVVSCSSDERLKENITNASSVIDWIMGMNIRDFISKLSGDNKTGVVAQEHNESYPEMVRMQDDGYYSVDEVNSWKLVKAIQELKEENDAMKVELCNVNSSYSWC